MMTEIELTPRKKSPDLSLTLSDSFILESSDVLDRKHRYKMLLRRKSAELLDIMKSRNWTFLKTKNKNERVQLYEQQSAVKDVYTLKADVVLQCAAERLMTVHTDYSYTTRSRWDSQDVYSIDKRETYATDSGPIDVVQTVVKMPFIVHKLGAQYRHFLGIQWCQYNSEKQRYIILFTTCKHPLYSCPDRTIDGFSSTLMIVKSLGPTKCFVSVVSQIVPGGFLIGPVLTYYKRRMRTRMLLYEDVCNNHFEEIYSHWLCATCNNENDAYLLECRQCRVCRYWKCLNKACRAPQPSDDKTYCIYCKENREENGA